MSEVVNSGRYFEGTGPDQGPQKTDLPTKIERTDLEPRIIEPGETEIILQRHGRYIRDTEDRAVGSLTSEATLEEDEAATTFFESLLLQVPEEERGDVCVLILASDTQYSGGGRRSLETATIVQEAAEKVFLQQGIPNSNIINLSHSLKGEGGPRPLPAVREPQMFDHSPDFVNFLKEKFGDQTLDFWIAFEEDTEKITRQAMGAEGPDEITDRMVKAIKVLDRYAKAYHKANPGKRLIIWVGTHYDTISPFIKREVLKVGKEAMLQVDYGSGVCIVLDREGRATTKISGKEYPVPIA